MPANPAFSPTKSASAGSESRSKMSRRSVVRPRSSPARPRLPRDLLGRQHAEAEIGDRLDVEPGQRRVPELPGPHRPERTQDEERGEEIEPLVRELREEQKAAVLRDQLHPGSLPAPGSSAPTAPVPPLTPAPGTPPQPRQQHLYRWIIGTTKKARRTPREPRKGEGMF